MRYIDIKEAAPGMELAYDLFDSFGRTLISANSTLTGKNLEKIKKLGVEGLYIEDELAQDIEIDDIISPMLKSKGMNCVKEADVNGCKDVATDIVNSLLSKNNVSLDLTDLRTFDDYTYSHSVNVAVLSSVIGLGLKLKEEDLVNLVLAGLLHDIGKLSIPPEILNKPGRLTHEEYTIMKNHAIYSYEKVKDRMDISAQVKQAILYHHENMDGSGYPNGVDEGSLSLYARVLHVADVYDALVSKRPYKEPYSPYEATEYLMGGCGAMFDQTVVSAFLRYVPIYPKGTEVMLSNKKRAIIFDNTGARNMRPIVRLVEDCTLIDLWDEEYLNITIASTAAHGRTVEAYEKARNEMISPVKRKKVLVVDEDRTNVEAIRRICEEYIISSVTSGEGAINYIESIETPDIVLMEVKLPGIDGVEAAKLIQEKTNYKVPILFVTAKRDRETVIRCRELNPAGYVLKPYKDLMISSEIKRVLALGAVLD